MRHRKIKGSIARISRQEPSEPLPQEHFHHLKEAVAYGTLRAIHVRRLESQIREDAFNEDYKRFETLASGNKTFLHLLMVCFLKKIHEEMEKRPLHQIKKRNFCMIGVMIQRELTEMFLTMHETDRVSFLFWFIRISDTLDSDIRNWLTDFMGANSAARLIKILLDLGADVHMPTSYIDAQWKIDLIAWFAKKRLGLCVQAKTCHTNYPLQLSIPDESLVVYSPESTTDDQLFLNGVACFRAHNKGTWVPIEIAISNRYFQIGSIEPEMDISKYTHMILTLIEKHLNQECLTITPQTLPL